ncbi:glycine receptor subunit alpha-3-like [Scylla paramamosain]
MRFGRDLGNQLVVEDGDAEVQYLGAAILPSHRLHNFTIKRVDGQQGITLAVFFNLERRPRVLVIKLFIPSLMLVSVGYVTLYIPRKLLQARLIVSLTTKLVLYTLFNQASSTLPITAYIKLIDIWFFFCICTLLSIILVHVLVEHLPEEAGQGGKVVQIPPSAAAVRIVNAVGGAEGGKKDNLNFSLRTHRAGIWCLTADRALKIMRYCIVPIATTIFLAFYWIAIMDN